jgi:hypothetical protein
VPVPKAAMHEDYFSRWPENDVGMSRQIARMEAVAIAKAIDEFARKKLRL